MRGITKDHTGKDAALHLLRLGLKLPEHRYGNKGRWQSHDNSRAVEHHNGLDLSPVEGPVDGGESVSDT
ncbi:hypothetical protein RvY_00065 [Ramazzottius varieornatus]|uniref:Uncharacterized protein n=1 Tax=Ramazzottius varieornatus TaxID=947166 RepID=A0A1D1UBD3_RAMVA|nr:hypothetical protein RvY_00065 [Ramazzottius varieornatus]